MADVIRLLYDAKVETRKKEFQIHLSLWLAITTENELYHMSKKNRLLIDLSS